VLSPSRVSGFVAAFAVSLYKDLGTQLPPISGGQILNSKVLGEWTLDEITIGTEKEPNDYDP